MLALLLVLALTPRTVDVRLGPVHAEIVRAIRQPAPNERFLDIEGALRAAKTWTILIAERTVLEEQPGIKSFIARWTKDDLNQKLVPDYRDVCELMGLPTGEWDSEESCFNFANGSRLYAVGLKTGSVTNRYRTVRGLTVARGFIDQLEEVPEDVYNEAALRLSQPGYAQQLVVAPNPVHKDHWIAKRFPVNNLKPGHRYLRLAMRDNAHNLDAVTIEAAELLYPIGHPLRRVKIDGHRGVDVRGKAVYLGAFDRDRHVATERLPINLDLPLYESYDYGYHHPAVIWYQWAPWGHLRILGGLMGSDLHLDAFLPIVERYRALWFPQRRRLEATCDPAGANENAQGMRGTPVAMLRDWYQAHGEKDEKGHALAPLYLTDANMPERRVAAYQRAATYMRRRVNGQEAFQVDPERWVVAALGEETREDVFTDGLDFGYVFEEEARHSDRLGTMNVPNKDGYYEHLQNCFEYGLQAHVLDLPQSNEKAELAKVKHAAQKLRDDARALAQLQKDVDPDDHPRHRRRVGSRVGGRAMGRRGGY